MIHHALKALHGCLETDKEFDTTNTVIGIVGAGERFHIIEGDEIAPLIAGFGAAQAAGAIPTDDVAPMDES